MTTSTNSATIRPPPQGEFIPPLVQAALPSEGKLDCQNALMRQPPEGFTFDRGFAAFIHKLWRAISVMNDDFKRVGDGTRSRARSSERLRDEQAWSRLDGEGSPNGREQPEDLSRTEVAGSASV
jgi:hypothetical protein